MSDGMDAESAAVLVQGNIDEIYVGECSAEYLELLECSEEEVQEVYNSAIESGVESFNYYFSIDELSDETTEKVAELYRNIYSKVRYSVGGATKTDETTFSVEVTIEPLDLFERVQSDFEQFVGESDFYEKYVNTDVDNMTDAERSQYDEDWAQAMLELCNEELENAGYKDAENLTMKVVENEDGVWYVSEDDFYNFTDRIIYYPE
jgi:hypothetical protein